MEDISAMINQFLSNPQAMEQIRGVAQSLGMGDMQAPPQQAAQGNQPAMPSFGQHASATEQAEPMLDLGSIMMLQKAMAMFKDEDDNTRLLRALRPHFSEERGKKVDDAIRILQLIRLLPLVKEMGLGSIFGGGDEK